MNLRKLIDRENLHHAYCIQGESNAILPLLKDFLENEIGFKTQNNPDFWHESFETFSVDESRNLKERQQEKSFGEKKFFVLSFNFITREAQNALLKIFEEPTAGTHFFMITRTAEILLPTLRSRLSIVRLQGGDEGGAAVEGFVNKNIAKRLADVKEIIESKDRNEAIAFLNSLEVHMASKGVKTENVIFLSELARFKKFLFLQGSSLKLVLEHIALVCPKETIS